MLQIKVMVRVESALDGKTGIDWFVIKTAETYSVTCLVLVDPVTAGLLKELVANLFTITQE